MIMEIKMVNKELIRMQTIAMQIAAEVNNLEFESDGRDTCSIVHNLKSRGKLLTPCFLQR